MSQVAYTIFKRGGGPVIRSGHCPAYMLGHQVHEGESILVGQALCDIQHRVEVDLATGEKRPCQHTPEEVARRALPAGARPPIRPATPWPPKASIQPLQPACLAAARILQEPCLRQESALNRPVKSPDFARSF